MPSDPLLYLSSGDLDRLEFGSRELVDVLESLFRHKGAGDTLMPPKIFFHHGEDRFYSAMASCCPPLGFAGCKWQSGDPANPARGLPYIQGLYVLTEHVTGQMVALMDAKWITGRRTAAASALVARYQARADARELAILGCGVQGHAHLKALAAELSSLVRCRAFDIVPGRQRAFVDEVQGQHENIEVVGATDAESACRGADVIVTGGPITARRRPTLAPDWVSPGALVVTIDYDSYVTDACIAAMDRVLTDDRLQLEDARAREGKFKGVGRIDADLGELVTTGRGRRQRDNERILAFNLGIALEDVATAAEVYLRARARGIGTALEP